MFKKGFSLKWGLIAILLACWVLPILIILIIMSYYSSFQARQQLQKTIVNSVESAVEVTKNGIINAMEMMRASTFEDNIKNAYELYEHDKEKTKFYEKIMHNLNVQYKSSNIFITSMIYFLDERDTIYYVGNNYNENALEHVNIYKETVHPTVKTIDERLKDKVQFLAYDDDTLYMIRPLFMNKSHYAVMVMEVNAPQLFRGLNSVVWLKAATVKIGNVKIDAKGIGVKAPRNVIDIDGLLYEEDGAIVRVKKGQLVEGYDVVYLLRIDSSPLWECFSTLERMLFPIILSVIPLLLIAIWMFYRHISRPVQTMVTAAEEIQNGELGYQITEKPKSHELNYLVENLNSMSKNTKEQFERSYNEQVALQNERIKALQSQINPHFLNNTLEIINWEARIADNQQVSSMIEALGTMLSAAMLRSGKTKASLREELEVVDAYLYIISVRMGSGLVVKKVIDESLLDIIVPCMILQPVVENAVEHGITPRQKGELKICINMQDNLLVMEIENNGTFSEENKSNIDRLLSWNGDDEDVIRSAEVGIRNVNYRLKLLYGSDAGLSIYRTPNDTTMAKIVLPTLNTNQSQ